MGKYDKVIHRLPKFVAADAAWIEKVDAVKQELLRRIGEESREEALADVHRRLEDARENVKVLEDELTALTGSGVADPEEDPIPMPFTATAVAVAYASARARKDRLSKLESDINLEIEALAQILSERYEIEGVKTIGIASGYKISVQIEPYASVEDRDLLREWAMSEGLERSLTLPWQTVNAIAKERLVNGQPEPPGVKLFQKEKLVMRKS
jgi:hypothetical protein